MAAAAALTLHKPKLKEILGIEAPNHLMYQKWEPGGIYTKPLVLKNVKLKTQKLKFRISSKNFFCDVLPHTVTLSAGNTCTLPVTFRPIEKNEITAKVEITTIEGSFTVPLLALLPKPKLQLQSSLQLGLCEVRSMVKTSFNITNTGSVATDFSWECSPPFEIAPSTGTLPAKGSLKLEARFKPDTASVYKIPALCHYDVSRSESITVEGTGKYPHLLVKLSDQCGNGKVLVAFNDVPLESTDEQVIDLVNVSPVPASFRISPEPGLHVHESAFKFTKTKGTVPPLGSFRTKVVCSPSSIDQCLIDRFVLNVRGGLADTEIVCTMNPIGPRVVIDKECVNFGSISCGSTQFSFIHLINQTDSATVYQFQTDPSSIFELDKPNGEIKGSKGSSVTVKVTFRPIKPIPYHRAITCLILNQDPLTVHFIGSAFSETVRPVQLSQQHISLYKSTTLNGLSKLPPEYLHECMENGSLTIAPNGDLIPDKIFHPPLNTLAPPSNKEAVTSMCNYFEYRGNWADSQHLVLEFEDMEFGYVSPYRSSEGKVVIITNNTHGSVKCNWMTGRDDEFQVIPSERELLPQSSAAFAVSFWPKDHSNVFFRELECYVHYKALIDGGFPEPRLLIPPWCLTLPVSGHSFAPNAEPFQVNIAFNKDTIVLPNTLPSTSSYCSFQIQSKSDTPTLYSFECNDDKQPFRIKPNYGVISGRSSQIFVARFTPQESKVYQESINCSFNGHPKFTRGLPFTGVCESASLILDKKDNVFFKSTCVGTSSETNVMLTNPCGLPLRYSWYIKGPSINKCLKIVPRNGVLQPNESVSVSFVFTPHEIKQYNFATVVSSTLLQINNSDTSTIKHRIPLCVYGEGTTGTIECIDSDINGVHVSIGTSMKTGIMLRNTSTCRLKIKIGARQSIETPDGNIEEITIEPGARPHGLEFGFSECGIQPMSQITVPVTLRPSKTATYTSTVFYCLVNETSKDTVPPVYCDLCVINVIGAYPTLGVADVQGEGVASYLSKSQIWDMLQVSRINHHLREEPSASELRYTISTRHSTSRRAPILTRAVLDFKFCPSPLSSKAYSTYSMILENPGHIESEWAFKFPMDMYMEPEFWAESGRIDPVEQHELDVVKNSLFTITPKQGTLKPGEQIIVKLSYNHNYLGTNRLPVLLKINRGREILLNLVGITSSPGSPCITMMSSTHTFHPVPLNTLKYPIQVFEIFNAGDVEGEYSIDTAPLDDLRESNYEHSILECLTPKGVLPPKQTTKIEFIFSPLEAKLYTVDLAFDFTNELTQVISFHGEGIPSETSCNEDGDHKHQEPPSSIMFVSSQLVQLSQTQLVLGDVPLFAVIQSVIFMRNTSDSTVSFEWKKDTDQVVSVIPSTGYLQPGQSAQLQVTFHSSSNPLLYNLDVVCVITDESEHRKYVEALKQCKKVEVRNTDEFTITDKKRFPSKRKEKSKETYEEWKKKDMSKKGTVRACKRTTPPSTPPDPPQSHLLHLCVTANTHSIPDYCHLHRDKFDSFNIDYNSIPTTTTRAASNTERGPVTDIEMNVVKSTLVECLRDLQNDTNFLASLKVIANERVPYFTQFSTRHAQSLPSDATTRDNASRHIYATGLEQIPSLVECSEHSGSCVSVEEDLGMGGGSGASIGLPKPPPPITVIKDGDTTAKKIKTSTEFQRLVDIVLDNVIVNVIKEVNKGEVSLTAPVYTIAKPPTSS